MDFELLKPYAIEQMKKDEIKTYLLILVNKDGKDEIEFRQYKKNFDEFLQEMKDNARTLSDAVEAKEKEIIILMDKLRISEHQQNNIYKDAQEKISELQNEKESELNKQGVIALRKEEEIKSLREVEKGLIEQIKKLKAKKK